MWKQYKRKGIAEMLPVEKFHTLEGISVSDEDRKNGSPAHGDMIARNSNNHADKWLVAKEYFNTNFTEL